MLSKTPVIPVRVSPMMLNKPETCVPVALPPTVLPKPATCTPCVVPYMVDPPTSIPLTPPLIAPQQVDGELISDLVAAQGVCSLKGQKGDLGKAGIAGILAGWRLLFPGGWDSR